MGTNDSTLEGEKIIINFPTKTEFYRKSQYRFIEEGLQDLVTVIDQYHIKSVALPPLGCGYGGLKWDKVKALIEQYLGNSPAMIVVRWPRCLRPTRSRIFFRRKPAKPAISSKTLFNRSSNRHSH